MTIIGIDLGTTNSLVAIMGANGPETLPNEFGDHLTPSVVAIADDGAELVGRAAKDRLVGDQQVGRAFFKRDMGTPATYPFGSHVWTPAECSARILSEMRRIAEVRLGGPVTGAVITVPAYFHDAQRQATMDAARIAGLNVARILNEPTAAALAFGYRNPAATSRLLVFDLGGGTFDVTVLEVFDGVIEVKASGGESRLGGEDFTDALMALVQQRLSGPVQESDLGRLRQQVEVMKRRFANADRSELTINGESVTITLADFAEATSGLIARLRPVVRRCLRDARLEAADLDDVLLVGGASRMPQIADFVLGALKRPGNREVDPDRVVALGAAVQAALCADDEAVQDLVLTDVCPHTLGVEVAKQFGHSHQNGFFSPIIDRNTTVPISRVERYHTFHPDQDEIDLKIYQGESRLTQENTKLGVLKVKGLRQRHGQAHPGEIDVRFTYDMNGILEVDIHVLSTDLRLNRVIESRPGALSPQQLEAAVQRMRPLKIHPRDSLPNRARIERASRLFGELKGPARDALSAHLDEFEAALELQEPSRIHELAAVLDSFMAHFFADEDERQGRLSVDADDDDGRGA